jgi:hypothetical protein
MSEPNRYARFRTWLLNRVLDGATPRQVGNWLARYRSKYSQTTNVGWADGLPEIPTEVEIENLSSRETW